jgi:hypothetical protein
MIFHKSTEQMSRAADLLEAYLGHEYLVKTVAKTHVEIEKYDMIKVTVVEVLFLTAQEVEAEIAKHRNLKVKAASSNRLVHWITEELDYQDIDFGLLDYQETDSGLIEFPGGIYIFGKHVLPSHHQSLYQALTSVWTGQFTEADLESLLNH